jgi:hypothetical protein
MDISSHKFILCIPGGGINDMIQQIMFTFEYAKKYNRKSIIDTTKTRSFKHNIFDFFDVKEETLLTYDPDMFYNLVKKNKHLTIHPNVIIPDTIDIFFNETTFSNSYMTYAYKNTSTQLDGSKHYDEDIVVHSNCGFGRGICSFLKFFVPKPIILTELRSRFSQLGENYLAIHIRNTDYVSDVSGSIITLADKISAHDVVFLASDDAGVISRFKDVFGVKIKTFSTIKDTKNKPYHYRAVKDIHFVIDAMCDFLLLTLAKDYTFTCSKSGYSTNANMLFRDNLFRKKYMSIIESFDNKIVHI